MSDDVPEEVHEQFRESVAFAVALDLAQDRRAEETLPAIKQVRETHVKVLNRLMAKYPSLEPTTEGFNPATIVKDEVVDSTTIDPDSDQLALFDTMEEWFEQRDEPIELHPTLEFDDGDIRFLNE